MGRTDDIEAVTDLVNEAPVVTLVGVGGVGKTRLAYEVASLIEPAGDRTVHVIELAGTIGSDPVARVAADSLGLLVTANQTAEAALAMFFSGAGPTLLVLDNCEHVVDSVASVADELLDRCPELTVLATSRVPLGIEGEHVWPVEPLAVGDGTSTDAPAIRLLLERATATHPGALVGADHSDLATLAAHLDGIPLALELAAARLSTVSVTELSDQLSDRVLQLESSRRGAADRHRSLAAVVDWSYQLLDEHDRRLARNLSVFSGSFTREAALSVVGVDDAGFLDRLVDTSLLTVTERAGGTRYLMLEMIRQFLGDALDQSGEADDVRWAHARWALERATLLIRDLRGPDERDAVAPYAADLGSFGAALAWSIDQDHTDLVTGLVRCLYDHVLSRGGREVHAWIETAVDATWNEPASGDVIMVAATAAMVRGDIPRSRQLLEQAEQLGIVGDEVPVPLQDEWSSLLTFEGRVEEAVAKTDGTPPRVRGDSWRDAYVLVRRSMARSYAGRTSEALELAERAVELAGQTRNPTILGWAHYVRGEALIGTDPSRAIDTYNQARRLAESVDNTFLQGLLSVALASALGRQGDPADALRQFRETIAWWQDAGAWAFLSTTLRNFGEFLTEQVGRHEEAVLVRCAVERLEASSAAGGVDADRDRYLRRILTERLGRERFDELRERSSRLSRDDVVGLCFDTIDEELRSLRQVSKFRVIVFTDLERSTQFMADRGDLGGHQAMRDYDERTNGALARHNGVRVKGTGDGVLATFSTVTDALRCVTELLVEVDGGVRRGDLPLRLRVGVHAGETIEEMGDVFGTIVNLAARVVDQADGGEILVTDTIRQIAVGSDYSFVSLGSTELKGIPEPIGLHRLEWC